ncbi:MAG TPA: hypothetical protein DCE14_09670 [Kosmotogaceae bacterium]|nr:hypothetical protein [Kosmotogaceae bacterium]
MKSDQVFSARHWTMSSWLTEVGKLFNDTYFSVGQGIFLDGITLKMLLETETGMMYKEIPENLAARFLEAPEKSVLFFSDGYNWFRSDSERLLHVWNPGNLFVDGPEVFFTFRVVDDLGIIIKAGAPFSLPFAISFICLVLLVSFAILMFWRSNDSLCRGYEDILTILEDFPNNYDELEFPEEVSSLFETTRRLEAELLDHKLANAKLSSELDEANSKVNLTNEMHHASMMDLLRGLFEAIEWRNHRAIRNVNQMLEVVQLVAQELGMEEMEDFRVIQLGLLLHDVGMLNIPERILHKPGEIDSSEQDLMMKHTVVGEKKALSITGSAMISDIVRHHHEKEDGSGYPDQLRDVEISIRAKIVAVTDDFFSLTEPRPWRPAFSTSESLEMMRSQVGTRYNERVFGAFERVIRAYIT